MEKVHCTSADENCSVASCRVRCAMQVIDELLAQRGAVSGDEVDALLDLRFHFRHRQDAEAALRLFCELRLRMEQRHYLAFFRMRRWLENHLAAAVVTAQDARQTVGVKLDHYCVEAIRRVSLCAALGRGVSAKHPRVRFVFRPLVGESVISAATSTLNA